MLGRAAPWSLAAQRCVHSRGQRAPPCPLSTTLHASPRQLVLCFDDGAARRRSGPTRAGAGVVRGAPRTGSPADPLETERRLLPRIGDVAVHPTPTYEVGLLVALHFLIRVVHGNDIPAGVGRARRRPDRGPAVRTAPPLGRPLVPVWNPASPPRDLDRASESDAPIDPLPKARPPRGTRQFRRFS